MWILYICMNAYEFHIHKPRTNFWNIAFINDAHKQREELGVMVYLFNLGTQEAEACGSLCIWAQPSLHSGSRLARPTWWNRLWKPGGGREKCRIKQRDRSTTPFPEQKVKLTCDSSKVNHGPRSYCFELSADKAAVWPYWTHLRFYFEGIRRLWFWCLWGLKYVYLWVFQISLQSSSLPAGVPPSCCRLCSPSL